MRLLIIEDEAGLRNGLKLTLEKQGYLVDTAENGEIGLEYALSPIYDAIVLDIMMPFLNGYEVLKHIRHKKIKTPVLMLSAKSEVDDKVTGLDIGADDYLTKPFDTKELIARIRVLTRRNNEINESLLIFADLTLNTQSKDLLCATKTVHLGAKEFQLLEVFFLNQTNVLSKELLFEKVWGIEDATDYNNVEVYISFIRKKLQFLGTQVQIKVIRNLGYRLELKHD